MKRVHPESPSAIIHKISPVNELTSPEQNDCHFTDNNFKCISLNENDSIPIRFSLKFVLMSPIDNNPASVQVMAWRRTGTKPLPELMPTQFTDAYMWH